MRKCLAEALVWTIACLFALAARGQSVPGVVINHIPASEGRYVGSPGLAVLPDGDYVASHDEFGPKSGQRTGAMTRIFRSTDKGKSWRKIADIENAFWSTLFMHRDALYLLGTTYEYGDLVIRRSTDGGATWTVPEGEHSGLLRDGEYHTAPVPVIEHKGRLWRGVEPAPGPAGWGVRFQAAVMSAPVEADLLKASNWTISEPLLRDPAWLNGTFKAWLEGNTVLTREGTLVDVLRVDYRPGPELAAIVRVGDDGTRAAFDPAKDFVSFPGGAKKFTIRWDEKSGRYWSLVNPALPRHAGVDNARARNVLAITSSPDLRAWSIHKLLLEHPDVKNHGFQYPEWLFDGKDIIAAVRTAHDDGLGGAHNNHDANYLTFHRIKNFRRLGKTTLETADLR